jgi:hypothetical protein
MSVDDASWFVAHTSLLASTNDSCITGSSGRQPKRSFFATAGGCLVLRRKGGDKTATGGILGVRCSEQCFKMGFTWISE